MFQILTTLYLLLLLPTFSLCTLVNVSIDDQLGDERTGTPISYSFGWSFGPNCTDCEAAVDPGQVFDRTWHDTSFAPAQFGGDGAIRSAGASFNGTAVYVVCILTHGFSNPNGNTDMAFFLDGVQAGSLEQPPNGDATYLYNQVVFSKTGLSSGVHNIRIDVGHNGTSALILFDRIIYTTDIPSSESASFSSFEPTSLTLSSGSTSPSLTLTPLTITEVNSLSSTPTGPSISTSVSSNISLFDIIYLMIIVYIPTSLLVFL